MFFVPKHHTVTKSATVPFSAGQMYTLVNAIPDYPNFLPWCHKARILSQTNEQVVATLTITKLAFNQSFTTINTLKNNRKIDMKLKNGPFKNLQGSWLFTALSEQSCCVDFHIEFNFSNILLDLTLSPIFNQIASTQFDAFIKQAQVIYD